MKKMTKHTVSQMLLSTVTFSTEEGNQTTLRQSGKPWQLRKNLQYAKYKQEWIRQTDTDADTYEYISHNEMLTML